MLTGSINNGMISFQDQVRFVHNIIQYLHVNPSHTRVACITWSANVTDAFILDTYTDKSTTQTALDSFIQPTGDQANLTAG